MSDADIVRTVIFGLVLLWAIWAELRARVWRWVAMHEFVERKKLVTGVLRAAADLEEAIGKEALHDHTLR